jgi:hypothetical protein
MPAAPDPRAPRAPVLSLLAGLTMLGLAAVNWRAEPRPAQAHAAVRMEDWQVIDLAGYLQARGLDLQVLPSSRGGEIGVNAFLAVPGVGADDVLLLAKDNRKISRWAGVVACEHLANPQMQGDIVDSWGECGLRADPFIFFGDPAVLASIREALRAGE